MVDINRQNNLGNTPLHHGFECGTSLEIVELLLSSGANVNIRNFSGQSLFHVAAKFYHSLPEATELLIKYGLSLKSIDDQGSSVIHEVLKNEVLTLHIIEKLLQLGAQPDHRDNNGHPPLSFCGSSNLQPEDRSSAEKMLIQYSVLKKQSLITKDCNVSDDFGDTVMCLHFCQDNQKREEWVDFRDSCIAEISEMGKISISELGCTLSTYLENSFIDKDQILNSSNLKSILINLQEDKFPIYKEMLMCSIKNCNFKSFIEDLDWFTVKSLSFKRRAENLNTDCIKKIIEFLPSRDLINLILAYCRF